MVNTKLYLFLMKSFWRASKIQFKRSIALLCISCPSFSQKCLYISVSLHKKMCGWLQNLCVCVYVPNKYVINPYIFITTNSVYNTTLLPISNVISKKLSRKNWSLHFVIADIRPLKSHLIWPGPSALNCFYLHSPWKKNHTLWYNLHFFLRSYTDLINPSLEEPAFL